jgi:hypothetical protein
MGAVEVAGSKGSLASLGHSLLSVGGASKAFVLAHPIGIATLGGVLLGLGSYHAINKILKKKKMDSVYKKSIVG